jgi:hypothetical protein
MNGAMKTLWLFLVTGMVGLQGCAWFKPSKDAVPPPRGDSYSSDDWVDNQIMDGKRKKEEQEKRKD